jgi:hypothetical protein
MLSRRSFIKDLLLTGAAAVVSPKLLGAEPSKGRVSSKWHVGENRAKLESPAGSLLVPKANALSITGTFLDEISHDIPHQNWAIGMDRDLLT